MDQTEGVEMPVLLVVGIVGMLLLSVAIVLFFVIYQKRLLAQQSTLMQLKAEHQKRLLDASIQTQEAERKRIAADLHDSVGSILAATKLYIKQVKPEQSKEQLNYVKEEALHLIDETIINIRSITHNLLPPSLERFGLIAAVEDLCTRLNELNQLNIDFQYNQDLRLEVEKEVTLYRIIQELLNNTFKHAEAHFASIELTFTEEQFTLTYLDDGKGVNFEWNDRHTATAPTVGMGLKSIESRANFLNADFTIASPKDKGIQVILKMPFTKLLKTT